MNKTSLMLLQYIYRTITSSSQIIYKLIYLFQKRMDLLHLFKY